MNSISSLLVAPIESATEIALFSKNLGMAVTKCAFNLLLRVIVPFLPANKNTPETRFLHPYFVLAIIIILTIRYSKNASIVNKDV